MPEMPENRPPDPVGGPPGATPSSWEALYGRLILRDGIATIPLALYLYGDQLALSAQQVWFASAILAHKWDADLPYPRLSTVAEQTGVSIRTLQYIRKSLETARYLEVHEGWGANGGRIANSYDFSGLFAALEAAIAADPEGDNGLQDPDALPDPPSERPDRSFLARFGRVISQKGIAAVPQALFTHQAALGLSPQQTWFVAYILGRRWTTGLPHPSLRRMAARTGYSERQIHNLKEELVALGYLRLVHRHGAGGGQDTNGYDFSGLLAAITARLQAATPAPAPLRHEVAALSLPVATAAVRPPRRGRRVLRNDETSYAGENTQHATRNTQDNIPQSAIRNRQLAGPVQEDSVGVVQASFVPVQLDSVGPVQESAMGGAQAYSVGPVQNSSVGQAQSMHNAAVQAASVPLVQQDSVGTVQQPSAARMQGGSVPLVQQLSAGAAQSPAIPATAFSGVGAGGYSGPGAMACNGSGANRFRRKETPSKQPYPKADSNRNAPAGGGEATTQAQSRFDGSYSPYIAGVIFDHSRELGDALHAPANVTQAHRLWHASGLGESAFVETLHEARRRVRTYQGRQGTGTITNRMGYFFRVVADLTGQAPGDSESAS